MVRSLLDQERCELLMFRMASNIVCNVKLSLVHNYNACFIRARLLSACVSLCTTSYATLEYLEPHPRMWFSPPTTLGKMPNLRSEDRCLANGWSVVLGITSSSNSHHINTVGFPQQTFNYSCRAIYNNASQQPIFLARTSQQECLRSLASTPPQRANPPAMYRRRNQRPPHHRTGVHGKRELNHIP